MSTPQQPKLRFFSNPRSRARMVRWMLEECGADYETVELEFGPEMKSPEYLSINSMGKVPALQHGDAVVTETGAILAYLAELFPEKRLAPAMGSPVPYRVVNAAVFCTTRAKPPEGMLYPAVKANSMPAVKVTPVQSTVRGPMFWSSRNSSVAPSGSAG